MRARIIHIPCISNIVQMIAFNLLHKRAMLALGHSSETSWQRHFAKYNATWRMNTMKVVCYNICSNKKSKFTIIKCLDCVFCARKTLKSDCSCVWIRICDMSLSLNNRFQVLSGEREMAGQVNNLTRFFEIFGWPETDRYIRWFAMY